MVKGNNHKGRDHGQVEEEVLLLLRIPSRYHHHYRRNNQCDVPDVDHCRPMLKNYFLVRHGWHHLFDRIHITATVVTAVYAVRLMPMMTKT